MGWSRLAEHITALLTGGESTQGPSLDERELESMELLSERFGKFERKQEETPLSMPTEENIVGPVCLIRGFRVKPIF